MEKPLDRRVRRTRRRLRDTLIELILEKGYDTITIQEITDAADLSRATFYLHYRDKDELLASSLEAMFDELVESAKGIMIRSHIDADDESPPILPVFEHVAEYSDLYRSLFGDSGVSSIINRTLNYIARMTEQQYRLLLADDEAEAQLPIPIEIAARHLAGALFSMISWWLENDMQHPPQEMARMFHHMTVPGIMAALGQDSTTRYVSSDLRRHNGLRNGHTANGGSSNGHNSNGNRANGNITDNAAN